MTKPVRWGVLGTADIARTKVIPAIQRAANCEVLAIASRDDDRAAGIAQSLGIGRSYGSYAALLDDPDVTAVYIPLPNSEHAEWALRAAAAGKHVLCEKPLAMSAAEAATIVTGCRDAGVVLMEAFMYRLHPLWTTVRELVAAGRIGDLQAVQAFFSYSNDDPANIRNIATLGGGALMDIGCYPINVARMMFGAEPTGVWAAMRRDRRFGTDVLTSAVLAFDDRQATFTCSTLLQDEQRVHLIGTEGHLLVEIPFNIPTDRPTRIICTTGGNAGAVPPAPPSSDIIDVPAADQYQVQAEWFAAAVHDQTQLPVPPEDAIANMAVIDRVFAAAGA
jgi:predicted dehydrogenase